LRREENRRPRRRFVERKPLSGRRSILFQVFGKNFQDDSTKEKISKDFELARSMNINAVPTVVINQQIKISGAVPTEVYLKTFDEGI